MRIKKQLLMRMACLVQGTLHRMKPNSKKKLNQLASTWERCDLAIHYFAERQQTEAKLVKNVFHPPYSTSLLILMTLNTQMLTPATLFCHQYFSPYPTSEPPRG
jgi:hypothetical protein